MLIKNGDLPVTPITANKLHESTCSNGYWERASMGLTKREYFAAMAMQGLLAKHGDDDYQAEQIADYAVAHADALLKKLERTK